ncbi:MULTISPECIES: branched-chain amino acid aminotransferase [Brochothrix]|uniref:Branched-chain-amino-acid aminotransferase n=1 Tax=Brochothrix thermosphacta TaxID=2756 RepID=A0A1D2K8Z0_BROTH|nr:MULTISPECIES: branched-chain amino acid aminotransferase [Brochothrix]ANZ94333.1 branched chain amino acid aminotransferase [Brochothrix thermosphacta]ANZ97369.1 branched chain amino acid aminotransferase [Brochothrix thermosphacta]ATF26804.1 branched-chain amino acid aminotransferase [Brochothrix thermosphacta]ATH86161.1 branched-chain amino acid aminotransferase [Brochothrix thermosphacta]EUJ37097.1 branched-chain amino acid aminotransferase [Brochothrix thermosphacta DSM 20171 = FSL F6-1
MSAKDIDFNNLGFSYIKTDLRYISYWKDGKWDDGQLTEDNVLHISEGSPSLHYGQQSFEGLKAYRCKDGSINLFRPDKNAERMQASCDRLLMPEVPTDVFVEACKQVVKANEAYLPPYGTGGSLYLRPFIIGTGDNIGVNAAREYIFSIFCMPVGPYFKGGMTPHNFVVSSYDRAAPNGTGAAKVGGNYAASLLAGKEARERKFSDAIYLDPATHTLIEEVGAANFFGITEDDEFVTPLSPSILPSITKYSLLYLAEHRLGLKATEGLVPIDGLEQFKEAGACGTAAVITPIGGIQNGDDFHVFYSETEVGPITTKLYDELVGIQYGDVVAPDGWIFKV